MNIFLAFMDWGLGHAARCVPIVELLQKQGANVIIGGEGRSLALMKATFPDLQVYELPAYNIRYSASNFQIPILLGQVPRLLKIFQEENKYVSQIIEKEQIDLIISDNRYGIWSKNIPSIYITHQLAPLAPFRKIVFLLQQRFLKHFDEIWIPDIEGENNLSGSLSHLYPVGKNVSFIGFLSRFSHTFFHPAHSPTYALTAILSGPEPQRSLLEEKIIAQAHLHPHLSFQIIQGKTEKKHTFKEKNVLFHSYMTDNELLEAFQNTDIVLSRSGYSSLMDYAVLGLPKIVLVPTPGQTEQEYIGEILNKKKIAMLIAQKKLDFAYIFKEISHYKGFEKQENTRLEAKIVALMEGK